MKSVSRVCLRSRFRKRSCAQRIVGHNIKMAQNHVFNRENKIVMTLLFLQLLKLKK